MIKCLFWAKRAASDNNSSAEITFHDVFPRLFSTFAFNSTFNLTLSCKIPTLSALHLYRNSHLQSVAEALINPFSPCVEGQKHSGLVLETGDLKKKRPKPWAKAVVHAPATCCKSLFSSTWLILCSGLAMDALAVEMLWRCPWHPREQQNLLRFGTWQHPWACSEPELKMELSSVSHGKIFTEGLFCSELSLYTCVSLRETQEPVPPRTMSGHARIVIFKVWWLVNWVKICHFKLL